MKKVDHPLHLIRYGIAAEQDYFDRLRDTYDYIALNANMLAHTPTGISKFIAEKIIVKSFFIDPQTHAFQHNPDALKSKKTKDVRKSLQSLIEKYGGPVECVMEGKAVLPKDFADQSKKEVFCRNVLSFQNDTISSESEEVKRYLENADIPFKMEPEFLVAPYFYMMPLLFEEWLPLNVEFVNIAKTINGVKEIWAQVVISKDILDDDDMRARIVSEYARVKPNGILLWVDDFPEDEVSEKQLSNLADIVSKFVSNGLNVINLFGGYFSILLTKFVGLTGVSHGLEYGEDRAVVPVGGGIPMAKFYFPALHKRVRYIDAVRVLMAKNILPSGKPDEYFSQVCDCKMCRETIASSVDNFRLYGESKEITFPRAGTLVRLKYPLQETRKRTVQHYLYRKSMEFHDTESKTKEQILGELQQTYSDDQFQRSVSIAGVEHLYRWRKVLADY